MALMTIAGAVGLLVMALILACNSPTGPSPTPQQPMSERQRATLAAEHEWDFTLSAQERVARMEALVEDCQNASKVPYQQARDVLAARLERDSLRPETREQMDAVLRDLNRADDAIALMERRCGP